MDKPLKSRKLRDSARGQDCTFRTDYCNYDNETTVLCHLQWDGGKMGGKTDDYSAAFGCEPCHTAIDQNKLNPAHRWFYMGRAMKRTWDIWINNGLLKVG